jgi:hypothetical protein
LTEDTHSISDDGAANGEVVYRVSTAQERHGADAGMRAVGVAQQFADMIAAGMLPGFVGADTDGRGRVRLVVDVTTAALIAQAFAREPGTGT